MLSLFGYSVWIELEGKELPQFQTTVDIASRTATCWIPSEAGKDFAVVIKYERRESDSRAKLFLDGSLMRSKSLLRTEPGNTALNTSTGTENGIDVERPFRFSAVVLTDDDAYMDRYLSNDLGTISVTMQRVHLGSKNKRTRIQRCTESKPTSQTLVHEKNKKVPTHCVSLGEARAVNILHRTYKIYDKSDPTPFVTFIFKYRPADFLQAHEIMPKPLLNPKRKLSERIDEAPIVGDDGEDSVEMQSQIQNLRVKLESMEEEFARKNARSPKKAKIEASATPLDDDFIDLTQDAMPSAGKKKRKLSPPTPNEIIDLT